MERVETGIHVLDELLQGGLLSSSAIGILGDVDSGKSTFCNQVAYNLLQKDFRVLYYSVDQGAEDVRETMKSFGWDVTSFEKKGLIRFVDAFKWGMETLLEETKEGRDWEGRILPDRIAEISYDFQKFIKEGRDFTLRSLGKKMLVVYDSISPLLFGYKDKDKVFKFLQHMKYATRICKALGILTMQAEAHGKEAENACMQLADGVIELKKITQAGHVERYMRIVKMSKTRFSEEYYPLEITNQGIVIHKLPVSSFLPVRP